MLRHCICEHLPALCALFLCHAAPHPAALSALQVLQALHDAQCMHEHG